MEVGEGGFKAMLFQGGGIKKREEKTRIPASRQASNRNTGPRLASFLPKRACCVFRFTVFFFFFLLSSLFWSALCVAFRSYSCFESQRNLWHCWPAHLFQLLCPSICCPFSFLLNTNERFRSALLQGPSGSRRCTGWQRLKNRPLA